jgi:hypothetical protein
MINSTVSEAIQVKSSKTSTVYSPGPTPVKFFSVEIITSTSFLHSYSYKN